MSESVPAPSESAWTPWRVAPRSGFEVADPSGSVGLVQIDDRRFLVQQAFRFSDPDIEAELIRALVVGGMGDAEARRAVDEARTFVPRDDNPTDLASIPRFMRWFENSYGTHSLAALVHDELITGDANGGRLGSDTLSDRFFREMMRAAGVPWLKRWIMWSAVALRTRFAAGGLRRSSVVVWIALSVAGLSAATDAVGAWAFGWPSPLDPLWLLVIAGLLPLLAAGLWGRQWGAGLVSAVTAFWLVPAAAIAGAGYLVYLALEHLAERAGFD